MFNDYNQANLDFQKMSDPERVEYLRRMQRVFTWRSDQIKAIDAQIEKIEKRNSKMKTLKLSYQGQGDNS